MGRLCDARDKCARGIEIVQNRGKDGRIGTDKLQQILAEKRSELESRREAIVEHESQQDYTQALGAIEAYAKWYHGSGIASLNEERASLSLHVASVDGRFLESVAVRWLEQEILNCPPCEAGYQRKVLTNVKFSGVSLPDNVASEFDAFVVRCRACDESLIVPK